MAKEDKRKSILVNEACFVEFNELRNTLNLNSSEALQTLLQKEITKTETTMINRIESGDFDNVAKQLAKEQRGD